MATFTNPTFNQLLKDFQVPNPTSANTLSGLFPFTYDSATINKMFQDAINSGEEVNKELYNMASNAYYGSIANSYDTLLRQMQLQNANNINTNASSGVAAANQLSLLLGASQQGTEGAQTVVDEQYAQAQQYSADRIAAEQEALRYQNELAAIMAGISNNFAVSDAQAYAAELGYWGLMQQLGATGDGGYGTGTGSLGGNYYSGDGYGIDGSGNTTLVGPNVYNAMVAYGQMNVDTFKAEHPELYEMQTIADTALRLGTLPTDDPNYQKAYDAAGKAEKANIANYFQANENDLLAIKQGFIPDAEGFGYTIAPGNPNGVSQLPVGYFTDSIAFNPESSTYGKTMLDDLSKQLTGSGLNQTANTTTKGLGNKAIFANALGSTNLYGNLIADNDITNLSDDAIRNYIPYYNITPNKTVAPNAKAFQDAQLGTAGLMAPNNISAINPAQLVGSLTGMPSELFTGTLTANNLLNTDDDDDNNYSASLNNFRSSSNNTALKQSQYAKTLQEASKVLTPNTTSTLSTTKQNANLAKQQADALAAQQAAAKAAQQAQLAALQKAAQEAAARSAAQQAAANNQYINNNIINRPSTSGSLFTGSSLGGTNASKKQGTITSTNAKGQSRTSRTGSY